MQEQIDSRNNISDFIFLSKYARTINGRKETWDEAVDRVLNMHWEQIQVLTKNDPERLAKIKPYFDFASKYYHEKKILGAQRALQYGGEQLKKHNGRMYNCTASYCDRIGFFREAFGLLLMGCGTGYTVYKQHVDKLPTIIGASKETYTFTVPDSIEGWAETVDVLLKAYVNGTAKPVFDFSLIRPKGSLISGGFKAPGHLPLKTSLEKIDKLLKEVVGRKLRPFEAHRIVCILADSVISGGIRRSALLALFDDDDEEMMNCKTGDWFTKYPELARANNTCAITPETPRATYDKVFDAVKTFGEPGVAFVKSKKFVYNPLTTLPN